MMRTIALNYDDSTGTITDDTGSVVGTYFQIVAQDVGSPISVDDLISLKKADFTVDEISELKRQKLLG